VADHPDTGVIAAFKITPRRGAPMFLERYVGSDPRSHTGRRYLTGPFVAQGGQVRLTRIHLAAARAAS
jgi:hypothetical protein